MTRAGILGCGSMGGRMATRLAERGIDVTGFDESVSARAALERAGVPLARSAAALAAEVELLILSLPRATIVAQVMEEIHEALPTGAIVLDTSTSEPALSQRLAAAGAARDYTFIDAPVSGGPAAAAGGSMTMLLGGDVQVLDRVTEVLDLLTTKRVVVGPSGAGHAAKIANNMLCAANLVLVAEALRIGEAAGIAPASLLEGINAGSGRSGVSEVNYPRWILNGALDSGFTMGLMRKDVRLALDLATEHGLALPAFAPIARLWEASRESLPDDADFNEIHRYREQER